MTPYRVSRQRFLAQGTVALGLAGLVPAPARAAQFEIKCASNQAIDHPGTIRMGQMLAAIQRESGGRIHAQFFPNSLLGGDASMFSQLRLGALQFYLIGPGQLAEVVPPADIGYLGFAYKDEDEGLRVFDGPLGGYIRRETMTKNIYTLRSIWNSGMYHIGSNTRAIHSPEDIRGFKVRVSDSKILVDLFKGVGASPTPMNAGEMYAALQTRVIDGEALPLVSIMAFKLNEVNKYVSMTSHAWSGTWLIANGDYWKTLPPDLQEILERNNTKYTALERTDTKALNASLAAKMTAQGIAVNRVDPMPFRRMLGPYFQFWANTFGPTEWGLLESSLGRKLS